ncbi:MAG: hypothetical protein QF898_05375 [SAR202 cluster bacterium]|jgi:hypothetical protein|nr:hypothetical protein [SAR202 cluster bacterium]MDP6514011.1 hypothetical protein [SAR202 cluster bacterium]MDP6713450.1 hypothetical protein [SAR202 cluster bacterium]
MAAITLDYFIDAAMLNDHTGTTRLMLRAFSLRWLKPWEYFWFVTVDATAPTLSDAFPETNLPIKA